jgi:hypothetical protein
MARLSRKSRGGRRGGGRSKNGRKPPQPPKDELDKLLAQLPADSLDRKILTDFCSKTGELVANFEAELAPAGREYDPRKAMEMAISYFEVTCETHLRIVHDLETARALERDVDVEVEAILAWFRQWVRQRVRIAAPGSAKAKELGPELTRQLLRISSEAKARAWHSLRVVSDAPIPATPVPAPEADPPASAPLEFEARVIGAEVHATSTKGSPSGKPGRRRKPETDPIVARWHAEGEPDIRTLADNLFPNESGSRKRYDQVRGAVRREKERRGKDRT